MNKVLRPKYYERERVFFYEENDVVCVRKLQNFFNINECIELDVETFYPR